MKVNKNRGKIWKKTALWLRSMVCVILCAFMLTPEVPVWAASKLGKYDDIYYFSEGLAPVRKNGKWGYINKKGKAVIKPQYDVKDPFVNFSEGLALVKKDGKWMFIDKKGKVVLK